MAPSFSPELRREARAAASRWAVPDERRAVAEVVLTVALYVGGLVVLPWAYALAQLGWRTFGEPGGWLRFGAGVLAVALLGAVQVATFVRAFLVNHDLLHGALFANRRVAGAAALITGTLSLTAPSVWKREHDRHHRDSNDLDREQDGQTASWTLARYRSAPPWQRRLYFVLNVPWVTFTVLPIAYFLGFMRVKARLHENALVAALLAVVWVTGRMPYFLVTFALAAIFGFYLFHLQHTFPGVYKRRGAAWDAFENALLGSSFLVLPRAPVVGAVLRFFSYGVECHDAHHLNPKIPGWRLARFHDARPDIFANAPRVTLLGGLRTLRASLWDEENGRLTSVLDVR